MTSNERAVHFLLSTDARGGWLDVVDPGPLAHLLDAATVGSEVAVRSIMIGRRGNSIDVRAHLLDFPADPPKRWRSRGYDRIEIELHIGDIHHLACSIRGIPSRVTIGARPEEGGIRVEVTGVGVDLACRAARATVINARGVRS